MQNVWELCGKGRLFLGCVLACQPQPPASAKPVPPLVVLPTPTTPAMHGNLAHAADQMLNFAHSAWAKQFVAAAKTLPTITTRTVYQAPDKKQAFTEVEAASLTEAQRSSLIRVRVDDDAYYEPPQYGDALAYTRPFDVWAEASTREHAAHPTPWAGMHVFDFGYGGAGHMRMLASLGVNAVGVDPDPMLRAMYSEPGDQGSIGPGNVRLLSGLYPSDPKLVSAVGSGYDLVISKNVLKRGYIHPTQPAPDKWLIKLGVDDATFLRGVHDALKPGGWFILYNICPAPSPDDEPFKPWSDGHSPFSTTQYESAGFDVVAFDRDDTPAARQMAKLLGWDVGEEKVDIDHDTFATYTLLVRY